MNISGSYTNNFSKDLNSNNYNYEIFNNVLI